MNYFNLGANQHDLKTKQIVSFKFKCENIDLANSDGGFAINFQHSHTDYDNIGFQISFRAPSNVVAINTRIKKKWGTEETIPCGNVKEMYYENPFTLGIEVLSKKEINVYLNGKLKTGYGCKIETTKWNYMCVSHCVTWDK